MSPMFDLVRQIRREWQVQLQSHSRRSFVAMAVYRFGAWSRGQPRPIRGVLMKSYGVAHAIAETISGAYVPADAEIGADVHLVHALGIDISPEAKIGDRVGIMQGVTIGANEGVGVPVIEDDVFIGVNASVLGPIRVGKGARIAANSLVVSNVPAGAFAVGVPAKVMKLPSRRARLEAAEEEGPRFRRARG